MGDEKLNNNVCNIRWVTKPWHRWHHGQKQKGKGLGGLGPEDQGPGTKGQGPRAKGQGPRAKGQGPRTRDRGPRAKGLGPGPKNKEDQSRNRSSGAPQEGSCGDWKM